MIGIYINVIMGFNKSVFNLLATPQFLFKEDYRIGCIKCPSDLTAEPG